MKTRSLLPVLVLLAAVIGAVCPPCATAGEAKVEDLGKRMLLHDEVRALRTWTSRFEEVLEIRPGMVILDIGTGTGRYAIRFAERLEGTGSVFATDIVPELVEGLAVEAKSRGLENLHPRLVTAKGVDNFYGRQTYDLIALFHASLIHLGKVDYFREMRNNLAPAGRFVVTYEVLFPPFTAADIVDLPGLVRDLASAPAGSPYTGALGESTRAMIGRADVGEALRDALVEDFNAIVHDLLFGRAFADGMAVTKEASFTPEEREFADWLLLYVKSNGLYDGAELNFGDRRNAYLLNRLLLVQRFRKFFADGVAAPYGHGRQGEGISAKLEEAGFRHEKTWDDVVPFEITLVFTRGE